MIDLRVLCPDLPPRARKHVEAALHFSQQHLSSVTRRTGESYTEHGCQVVQVLRESMADPALFCVALLHDLLLLPNGDRLLAESPLTQDEKILAKAMHELRGLHIDEHTHDLDQVINAFAADARLLVLRMAHRVNDIRHLDRFPRSLRKRVAQETLHMYASIAGRMGMQAWRIELEDKTFPVLHPKIADDLLKQFAAREPLDRVSLQQTQQFLGEKLRAKRIPCRMETRVKSLYSSYRKMVRKHRRFEDLTDRLALRLITDRPMDCYRALAVVHEYMHPIPGKLKDYIGAPKENGYRSIHTVVYPLPGVTEQPIEVQIRTEAMHKVSQYGPAAHGEYKNVLYAMTTAHTRVALFRDLESLREEVRSPRQFAAALGKYFREDHLAVFDAQNNLYHLSKPLTALDFVCHAYPKQFARCKKLKVNGREQPIDIELKDGDTVEAVFGRSIAIDPHWLQQCKHDATRKKIRLLLKEKTHPIHR